jgi:hypothetical protein
MLKRTKVNRPLPAPAHDRDAVDDFVARSARKRPGEPFDFVAVGD